MNNRELSIIMRLRDEASKRLEGVKGNLQRFANAWKKNWLAITAAVTAAVMALRKAWDLMELGAKADQIENSFSRMAESVGINSGKMRQALMDAAGATVNFSNVADKASALMAQGLSMDQVTALMRQARVEAKMFGTTTEEAFQNISSAVTGGLVTTLRRSYGLQLSLKDAVEDFAKATGKSTDEIQKNYMAQALANHILDKSKAHLKAVNLEVMTSYEKVQKLKSQWLSFAEQAGQALWQVLGFFQGVLNHLISGLFRLLEVGAMVFEKILIPFQKLYDFLGRLPGRLGEAYRETADNIRQLSADMEDNRKAFELTSVESARIAMEQYNLVFSHVKDTGDRTAEILKETARQVGETAEAAAGEFDKLETSAKTSTEKAASFVTRSFDAMQNLTQQTASNMQSMFSDYFFKVFSGEVTDAKEMFADFGKQMLKTISDVIAQFAVTQIFSLIPGFGGGMGGFSFFHKGGMVEPYHKRLLRAHSGLAPDEIPIIAQTGEGIVSRRGMLALGGSDNLRALNRGEDIDSGNGGGGGVTININQVIQAWDTQDVWRNRRMLSEAIADDIYSNGRIRSVIRNFT